MRLLFFLIAISYSLSKPHRTVVTSARSFNQPLQATVTFTGTVCASCEQSDTCSSDSTTIDSVTVVLNGTDESTVDVNDDGTFTLSLPEGETTIEVTATCPYANGTASDETATSTQTVTVVDGQPASAEFSLQCTSLCIITVPVVVQVCAGCNETTGCSEEGAELVAGRMMALYPVENGTDMPTATIDAEGNGTFDSVAPGDYYVQVYDDPYGSSTIEVAGQITVEEGDPDLAEQETQYFGTLILANSTLCEDPAYLAGRVCADCPAEPPAEGEVANGTSTDASQCASPLANATVRLTVVAENGTEATVETTTNELGFYQLEPANLTGNYTLEITAAECTGTDTVFAQVTGEINATAEPARTEVNVSAFCTQLCTANISGRVYSAENDTANYTEGITPPLAGITVQLDSTESASVRAIVATAVTDAEGAFEFVSVPFGDYTVTALDVPSTGGVSGEGCAPTLSDISVSLAVERAIQYNVSLVSVQECNNATLCGQLLFSANYCTAANATGNSTANSTEPFTLILNTTNCTCQTNISFVPPSVPPFVRPGQFPPPPPPPFGAGGGEIERLWRAFLLGTNYPTAAHPQPETETETESEKETPALTNQRILPPRIPAMCPPPCPPRPHPHNRTRACTCTAQGTVSSCFNVVAPLSRAVVRLMRSVPSEETESTLYQTLAETAVLPNGSFCFTGLPEGDNYILEIIVAENDTLNLAQSNISDAYGAITSTVVTQEGAYPPTQQVVSFGPLTLTGADGETLEPFVAVFEDEEAASSANVTVSSLNFTQLPLNATDNSTNSTNSTCPPAQIRYMDPWSNAPPHMFPLSSPASASPQRVRRTQKKNIKKPQSTVVRTAPEQPSSIAVIRPHAQTAQKKSRQVVVQKPAKRPTQIKHDHKKTTHTKRVSTKSGSSSKTVVTRRN